MIHSEALQSEFNRLMAMAPDRREQALAEIDVPLRELLAAMLADKLISQATTDAGQRASAQDALVTRVNPDQSFKPMSQGQSQHQPTSVREGGCIGPYTLDAWLGDGGSASVFRAHRMLDGVRQTVAIKVLRRGLQALEARQQFDRERRVLSVLEHASIARWIDGGVTADGFAYLVLEYVDGQSITSFVRARKLSLRARINLMIEVAGAVEAAHRALIVHRDLKPGNLMVNESGQVKLLDFGIAKLLHNENEPQTQVHMYTPAYAAPEQRNDGAITTATDVYAMGVILGELLTGKRFNSDITTTPSLQIDDRATEEGTLPAPPAKLRALIKGDIDNILLKALATDPNKRYASAAAFAEDLTRALDGRPVLAHPPSRGYRTWKFVSRNRTSVALVSALSLGIIAASVISVFAARDAQRAQLRAQNSFDASVKAVNDLTVDLAKNLREARGVRAETVASVLQKAQTLVNDIERTDPGNVALEHARIGMLLGFSQTYRSVARSSEADAALDDGWRRLQSLQRKTALVPPALFIDALLARSEASYYTLDWRASADDASQALALAKDDKSRSWRARAQLANARFFAGELKSVQALFSETDVIEHAFASAETDSKLSPDAQASALDFHTTVASAQASLGLHNEAQTLRLHARAVTQQGLRSYPNSVDMQWIELRLVILEAHHLLRIGQAEDAFALTQNGVAQVSEAIKANPNSSAFRLVARSLYNLRAQLYRRRGEFEQELGDLRISRDLLKELSDRDIGNNFLRAELSFAERRLAGTLLLQKNIDFELVEASVIAALIIDQELLQRDPKRPFARRYLSASLEQLGGLRRVQKRYEDANAAYQESLQLRIALAQEFPSEASWRRLLAFSHEAITKLAAARGDFLSATKAQRESALIWEALRREVPEFNTEISWFDSQLVLTELLLAQRQDSKLAAEAQKLIQRLNEYAVQNSALFKTRSDLLKELDRLQSKAKR